MADELYLNLWFPSFAESEMVPRTLSVLKQFPYSASAPGISYLSVRPLAWSEPTLLERKFQPGADPDELTAILQDFSHSDYAFEITANWDLWTPIVEGELDPRWELRPNAVNFPVLGTDFEEGIYQEDGHIQIAFGMDSPFLNEEDGDFTPEIAARVKSNVAKLVTFTQKIEQNCGISGRILWSESDENLAEKLIHKLQKVQ